MQEIQPTLTPTILSAEELRAAQTMSIVRVAVTDLAIKIAFTTLNVLRNGIRTQLVCDMYTLDDDRIRGYLPAKSFCFGPSRIELMFYTSPSLPDAARPFESGNTYVLVYECDVDVTVEYDIEHRILVDQQVSGSKVIYIIIFGDKQYSSLIAHAL